MNDIKEFTRVVTEEKAFSPVSQLPLPKLRNVDPPPTSFGFKWKCTSSTLPLSTVIIVERFKSITLLNNERTR